MNIHRLKLFAFLLAAAAVFAAPVRAEDPAKPVASVNGKVFTEADMALAEADIGASLEEQDPLKRRRLLTEFLIENEIYSVAARKENVAQGPEFEHRLAYWRRRVEHDIYFDQRVTAAITESEIKTVYEAKIKSLPQEEEVHARHILVKTEDEAKAVAAQLGGGADFGKLAEEKSLDKATKADGGDLGYFGRGKLVPQVEVTAFKLTPGQISPPVESPYGWHIVKLEERRPKAPPPLDLVKDRVTAAVSYGKAHALALHLRQGTAVEYLAPDLKQMVEQQNSAAHAEAEKKASLLDRINKAEESEKKEKK